MGGENSSHPSPPGMLACVCDAGGPRHCGETAPFCLPTQTGSTWSSEAETTLFVTKPFDLVSRVPGSGLSPLLYFIIL